MHVSLKSFLQLILDKTFLRFLLFGVLSTALHFLLMTLFFSLKAITLAGTANFVASTICAFCAFIFNCRFVFDSELKINIYKILKFILVYSGGAMIHFFVPYVMTDLAGFHINIAFLLALCVHVPLTYLLSKYWIFKTT